MAIFTDSFEDGNYSDHWNDNSQSGTSPSVNNNRAYDGSYSLDLGTAPGSNTKNEILTIDSWIDFYKVTFYANKYNDSGGQNALQCGIRRGDGSEIYIFESSYFSTAIEVRERDSNGNNINYWTLNSTETNTNTWNQVQIRIDGPNDIYVYFAGHSVNISPTQDFTTNGKSVFMSCNAWDSGHDLDYAFDYVTVELNVTAPSAPQNVTVSQI